MEPETDLANRMDELNEKATNAIRNAMKMTEEVEETHQFQMDAAYKMAERLQEENEQLKKQLEANKALGDVKNDMTDLLDEENEELTSALKDAYEKMDFLELGISQLREEANRARRDMNGLQLAVSILIFVYGVIYGKYSCM
jgi:uncharacterized phage infection (PIP) family protein YhgE